MNIPRATTLAALERTVWSMTGQTAQALRRQTLTELRQRRTGAGLTSHPTTLLSRQQVDKLLDKALRG